MLRRFLLSAALLAVFAAQGWAAGPTVSVGAGVLSLAPGQTLPAAIRIADIQNVYGFEMELKFDPSVVQVVDADPNAPGVQLLPGDFLSSDLIVRNTADNAAGVIQYAVTQLNPSVPKSGSGTLFTLNIVGGTAGKSGRIEVAKALFATRDGELIPVAASSGEVVVAAQTTVVPTVTTQPSRTPSPTSVPPTATLPPVDRDAAPLRDGAIHQRAGASLRPDGNPVVRRADPDTHQRAWADSGMPPPATAMAAGGVLPTGTPARPGPPAQEQTGGKRRSHPRHRDRKLRKRPRSSLQQRRHLRPRPVSPPPRRQPRPRVSCWRVLRRVILGSPSCRATRPRRRRLLPRARPSLARIRRGCWQRLSWCWAAQRWA